MKIEFDCDLFVELGPMGAKDNKVVNQWEKDTTGNQDKYWHVMVVAKTLLLCNSYTLPTKCSISDLKQFALVRINRWMWSGSNLLRCMRRR